MKSRRKCLWVLGDKMTFRISDILIGGSLIIIGLTEIAHLAGCLLGWSFLAVTDLLLAETVFCVLAVLLVCLIRNKKRTNATAGAMQGKRTLDGNVAGTQWILTGVLAFVILIQMLRILSGNLAWLDGDMTLETVNTFLAENAIYSVNPLTGAPYASGMSFRLKILCLPTLYGTISRWSGMAPAAVVYRLIPCITLGLGYFAYGKLGNTVFEGNPIKIRTFLLMVGILFSTGRYMPGVDGFDMFYGGFRGVTIRAVVLIPYLIACLMEKKYFGVALCILAEACMVWPLYGAGVCLLITFAWVVLRGLSALWNNRQTVHSGKSEMKHRQGEGDTE